MVGYRVTALDESTWPDFARLVERHGGVWGGCWCMSFHPEGAGRAAADDEDNRTAKLRRVRAGEAHAALVYDGETCVGWAQFGAPGELPRIKRKRAYTEGLAELPDWRITCFFVDKSYRRTGVAAAALDGALQQIARLGGGRVESYPEQVTDRSVSSSFLHNGTLALFERHGFARDRRIGKHHWVVSRVVD
jgi:GNAT superfamily N-acetyltransferase